MAVINQSDTVQNFQKFKQALRNFEETEKTRISKRSDDNSILKAKVDYPKAKSFNCYNCGLVGHKAADCRKPKEKKWCYYCKSTTHSDKVCRKLKDRDKAKKAVDDNAEHSFIFKVSDDEMYLAVDNETFLVDSGATTHIVNKDENFIYVGPSFKPEEHFIELADGTRANNIAKKRGTVAISMHTANGNIVQATIGNALFIPTYPQCIFSVQVATKRGATVNFHSDTAELITKGGTTFPIQQHGRLYYQCKSSGTEKRSESLEMWHKILGHCNIDDVTKLEHVVKGMKIIDLSKFDCETCTLAKQLNTRNREPDARGTYPFELVHTDLAGPIDPVAKDGFRYAMIFTDDYSGCLFTYFLKEKSDAVKATEKFLSDIAPYGKVKTLNFYEDIFPAGDIKRMRSDNGGKKIAREFKALLV